MKRPTQWLFTSAAAAMTLLTLSGEACAYIDPASGSYVLQLLIAGLVGSGFAVKLFWRNIKVFLAGLFTGKKKAEPGETSAEADDPSQTSKTETQDDGFPPRE